MLSIPGTLPVASSSTTNRLVQDSIVDPSALNFPEGTYGTAINGQTFQQEAVLSHNGYQYAAYYAGDRTLSAARRKLPGEPWETIRFTDYTIENNDIHNVVSIGVCRGDGTIHLAFDHHVSELHYRRSVPELASSPEKFEWRADQFFPITSELESGAKLEGLTYPHFICAPNQKLQMLYRIGASGDGDWYLAEYDPGLGSWTVLGMLFTRVGTFENSLSRCAYPNPVHYDERCRLHISWCWRERPAGGPLDLRTNHDLCYSYSDDFGREWRNNEGEKVARLLPHGSPEVISVSSPGIVVQETRFLWGQMNTTTQFVDGRGRVHIINWQQPPDAAGPGKDLNSWRYYHCWRDEEGEWYQTLLPFWGRKPQLVVDSSGIAYVIYCASMELDYHNQDPGGTLCLVSATEQSGWTDWRAVWSSQISFVGEPQIDQGRWTDEGILSVYLQEKPVAPGRPSALHVIDFLLTL